MIEYNIRHCKTFNGHSFWNGIESFFKNADPFLVSCNIWTDSSIYKNLVEIMNNHSELLTTVEYSNDDKSTDIVKLYLQTTEWNAYRYIVHIYNIEQEKYHVYLHNPLKHKK